MSYQVPQYIDKDKIFIVNRSEIEGRFDPKMALYNKRVRHALYPMEKLKKLLWGNPQYGANEVGVIRENSMQPRYIRITDIDENGFKRYTVYQEISDGAKMSRISLFIGKIDKTYAVCLSYKGWTEASEIVMNDNSH